ncbi:hypothetical protein AMAG_15978 [Allomyces macrogynus ATCC 38327]|uniref:RBR-type E3 ubiquitin transferase n=1 Tax=Allomyces macrogynus (strain ATCC 38327) TaxID=578462 RepID=A0A0L0TBG1_ALLM3|nr:hypothetical protein AMAG_15978 [Allomyces macrogynus ATCC 38327]|eukprot:KNE72035.1 hypothetical protein AMAG_15978 [Allomyces macrogynus ATCC 38327]
MASNHRLPGILDSTRSKHGSLQPSHARPAATMTTMNVMDWTANMDAQADEMIALEAILGGNFAFSCTDAVTNDTRNDSSSAIIHHGAIRIDPIRPGDRSSVTIAINIAGFRPGAHVGDVALRASHFKQGTKPIPSCPNGSRSWTTVVNSLPPVSLHFALPTAYPSHALPTLSLACAWLANSTLDDLTSHVISTLDAPADANVQLYMAYEAAREAFAAHLASLETLTVSPAVYQMLVDHDRNTKQAEFDQHEFMCLICLTTHRGRDGMPMNVRCPHPQCAVASAVTATAHDTSATTGDAKDVAAKLVWCARPGCTGAARRGDGIYAKMATCMQCQFVFCVFCLRAWHGNASGCESPSTQLVVKAYLDAEKRPKPERDRVHAELAMRYGSAAVMAIVQRHRHEHSIKALLKKLKAQRCPYCRQATIKEGGCNHMTCATCGGHFCYLCGAGLNHLPNYYVHWRGWGENLCEGLWEKGRRGGGGDGLDDDV